MIKEKLMRYLTRRKWRKMNQHNETTMVNMFPLDNVSVGKYTYGEIEALIFNKKYRLNIGSFCSIGPHVTFVVSAEHNYKNVSSFPFRAKCFTRDIMADGIGKGNITIGDDVWIGCNSTILSGVTIGQGAVVAAGTVVDKNIPPYAIVGGVPAKIIKYRFSNEIIERLVSLDYSCWSIEDFKKYENELYTEVNEVSQLDWICK